MADPAATAAALGISPATLRRWLRQGAPQARKGRRGRGGGAELDPRAIAAWRSSDHATVPACVLAAELPEILADSIWAVFVDVPDADKRRVASALAAAWYAATCAIRDRLATVDPSIPETDVLPEKIDHLMRHFRRDR